MFLVSFLYALTANPAREPGGILLQRALQMQQNGTRADAAGEVRPLAKHLQMQAEQGLGLIGREPTSRKAVWLQIRCKCSQTACWALPGRGPILVKPALATTSERRLFGERR